MPGALKLSAHLPFVLVPARHHDDRGWVSEIFRADRLRELGIVCSFVQDNLSSSRRKGTLRGLHFQQPPAAQAKLVSVVAGAVLDLIVDVRHASPTYGKWVSVELSRENDRQLFVPIGFAHGLVTLVDAVTVLYKVSDYYAPDHDTGIRWNDPDIAVAWPFLGGDMVRSERDDRLPLLAELESPFAYDGHPLAGLPTVDLD